MPRQLRAAKWYGGHAAAGSKAAWDKVTSAFVLLYDRKRAPAAA
jgi:hypothetical protein